MAVKMKDVCGKFRRQAIAPEVSVGLCLKTARVGTKQSLQFYSRLLNIPIRYLRALEEESLSELPGLIYEKHFIARYAESLRLDGEALAAQWIGLREGEAKPLARFIPRLSQSDLWVSPLFGRRLFAGLFFLALALYVGGRLWVMVEPPSLILSQPQNDAVVQGPQI